MAGKIIKSDAVPDALPERSPLSARPQRPAVLDSEVYDAHQKAKEIIEQAERQAAALLEKAEHDRDAVVAAAREMGRQEGLAQVTETLLRAQKALDRVVAESEEQIVRLALAAAEKIVGKAIELDEDTVLHVVAQAIESVRQQKELVLRVNPQDAQLLRNSRKKLMDLLGRTKDIAVREDPEVDPGGCIIETENGTVDAQLKTQVQMLEQALLGDSRVDPRTR